MTPLRKILASFVLVGTLTVSGVACSKSTESAKTSDTAKTTDTAKTSDTGTSDTAETSDTGTSDTAKPSGTGSNSAWCKKFDAFKQEADAEDDSDFDFTDSDAMISQFEKLADQIDSLAKDAPKEIRDDMQYLAESFRDSITTMASDDTAVFDEFEAKYDEDEVDAVTERIEDYVMDVCGIDLSS